MMGLAACKQTSWKSGARTGKAGGMNTSVTHPADTLYILSKIWSGQSEITSRASTRR